MPNRSRAPLAAALALGAIATLALASVAQAAEVTLNATLSGAAEGSAGGDTDGSGTAKIVIDVDAGTACWTLNVENIEPATQSHIHVGAEGVAGDVVVPLDVDGFDGSSEGCTEDQDASVLQAILDNPGGYYVNVHTADFPPGAIRGQLAAATPNTALAVNDGAPLVPIGATLLSLGLALGVHRMRTVATRD